MKKSFIKKPLTLLLSLMLLLSFTPLTVGAADIDYTIVNPYAAVNWSTTGQYKANLHTHSDVSDGSDFASMVERHYELGYDVLAMTDHATVDRSWTDININPWISFVMNADTLGVKPTPLTAARFLEISNGAGRDGRGTMRVPYGIEHNAAALDSTHVNSYFADFGDGYLGGTSYYNYIVEGVEKAGGVSVISHPGDYAGANTDSPDAAYDKNNSHYDYVIKQFTTIFKNYKSCLGMEIFNMSDRTKNDRKLWDILLAKVIPSGRNIFAFSNSDAHSPNSIDTDWDIMCMPANNIENLRACMEQGAFFAGTRKINNSKELAQLESETGLVLGTAWVAPGNMAQPKVTNITVDNQADKITIDALNQKIIHWVANGKVICTGNSLDLKMYSASIGSYVRAEIWGEGGMLYTQPFILRYAGEPAEQNFFFFDYGSILNFFERAFYNLVAHSNALTWLQHVALGD